LLIANLPFIDKELLKKRRSTLKGLRRNVLWLLIAVGKSLKSHYI